jgi:hypothetical protein
MILPLAIGFRKEMAMSLNVLKPKFQTWKPKPGVSMWNSILVWSNTIYWSSMLADGMSFPFTFLV